MHGVDNAENVTYVNWTQFSWFQLDFLFNSRKHGNVGRRLINKEMFIVTQLAYCECSDNALACSCLNAIFYICILGD